MKNFFLLFIAIHFSMGVVAQSETEPNNTIPTANNINYGDMITASLDAADADNFKMEMDWHGNLWMDVEFTNTGSSPISVVTKVYNSLQSGGNYVGQIYQLIITVEPGENFSEPIHVCGLAPDDYYIEITASDNIDYTFTWYPSNTGSEDGNNNTTPTATSFAYNTERPGSIGYEFWGNYHTDTIDYFTTTLPVADYDSVSLKISATSNNCSAGQGPSGLQYFLYKNGSSTAFSSGYVGDENAATAYQKLTSVIPLNTMQAGDVLLVKLTANGPFTYKLKYSKPDFFEPDEEYNDDYLNAIDINEDVYTSGNVGEYDYFNMSYIDEYDTYRITVDSTGSLEIPVWVRNDECKYGNYVLTCYILDIYGNEVGGGDLIYSEYDPPCNETLADTILFRGINAGSYYLQIHTKNSYEEAWKLSYRFKYNLKQISDYNETESNNSRETAQEIGIADTIKGNVNFMHSPSNYDRDDYFKVNLTDYGRIAVKIKAAFKEEYEVQDMDYTLQVVFSNDAGNNFGYFTLPSSYVPIYPDSVISITDTSCVFGPGSAYIKLFTSYSTKWKYEFSYEIIPVNGITTTETEPNNNIGDAVLIKAGDSAKGSLNLIVSPGLGQDYYDYYQLKYPAQDSLVVTVKVKNVSCFSNAFNLTGFRNSLSSSLFNHGTTVSSGDSSIFIIRRLITAGDSVFLRFYSSGGFLYEFSTKVVKPSNNFIITGDTTACMNSTVYKVSNTNTFIENYNWSLPDGGGTLVANDSIATVTWSSTGNRRVQVILTNVAGSSNPKSLNVVINGIPPTQVPVMHDFARTLSVETLPAGSICQWYRNDTIVEGATSPVYYAALAGNYHVRFVNDCGPGPVSNTKNYTADAIAQTISIPFIDTLFMQPGLRVELSATASSNLPVSYSVISGPGNIVLDTLNITATGTVIVKLHQSGDEIYSPAEDFDTIVIKKGNQVLEFDSIPTLFYDPANPNYVPTGSSNVGLTPTYTIVSGNAYVYHGWVIIKTGVGPVTARIQQAGNSNYNAAAPVDRNFCITIRNLPEISGEASPCLATYRYNALKVPGANYVWTLSSGGILTTNNDTAWVQWQTAGNHTLKVKAISPCDTVYTNEAVLDITTSDASPGIVSNMLPADHAQNQQLPLTLSWIAGPHTVNYDLYVWDSAQAQPTTPYKANISTVNYTLPLNSFAYNTTYKWKLVSKNPCHQTESNIQHFRLIPLPDLQVSNIQFPPTANSGQQITVSWTVTNNGPGNTLTSQKWKDAVFFSFDTLPNFQLSPNWSPSNWSSLTANGRPLLVGTQQNATALNIGQSYTNSVNFTLPLNYSQPLYVYVITDYQNNVLSPLQVTKGNDTLRAVNPMNVVLSPTPDLRVDSVFAPISAFSGSNIQLSYRVKNYGFLTAAGKSWVDSVFISQNPLFDRQQCMAVDFKNNLDQYYPDMIKAHANVNTQLNTDSSYTRNLEVIIPNKIFGTWFIYVKTNAKTNPELYEGAFADNNVNKAQVQVYLTPTPKLVVQDFSLPISEASVTQPIGLTWNIKNEGFYDNIEKNQGHFLHSLLYRCPCYSPQPNTTCVGPAIYRDSTLWGSSYWIDRVYLSNNPSGLNISEALLLTEFRHGVKPFAGVDFLSDYWNTCDGELASPGYHNVATAIKPNASFPGNYNFKIPAQLPEGNYYLYVYTNPSKTVFEYPGTAQIKRSSGVINIRRPDVLVNNVTVPANVSGGTTFTLQYDVLNNSTARIYNHIRKDRIYVSDFNSFDASAQLIGTQTYTENIDAGAAVQHDFNFSFPANTTGAKYFFVHTNYDTSFAETNHNNNINSLGAETLVSAAVPGDLYVQLHTWPDTVYTMTPYIINYTVKNNGAGTLNGIVTDSVFASCSPVYSAQNSFYIGKKTGVRHVQTDSTYSDTIHFHIRSFGFEKNTCFPVADFSNVYFFIKTNSNNGVYEATAISNNLSAGQAKVLKNKAVDHIVKTVQAPDNGTVGRPFPVSYVLQNIGYRSLREYSDQNYYSAYTDGIYLSTDSVYNSSSTPIQGYLHYALMNRLDTLKFNKQPVIPDMPTGDYYVLVSTNFTNTIRAEINLSNNFNLLRDASGAAKKIHIERPDLPDLKDSLVYATPSVAIGQQVTIIRKVTNIGNGPTYPVNYENSLYLSSDYVLNYDPYLGSNYKRFVLQPGQSYLDTLKATIRLTTVPGNYVLIDKADAGNDIVEPIESNNLVMSNLLVYSPPEVDLLVNNIAHPDTVLLGYTLDSAKWVIQNASAYTANGNSSDAVYLSANSVFDSTATLMEVKNKVLNMAPLKMDTISIAPMIKNVTEGNYYLYVTTDVLNNIVESDKSNNTGRSAMPVYVKVKELPMNVDEHNTLQKTDRYYKLLIPDSLRGATIMVTLTSNDSLSMRNEMFIAGGFVPTAANYHYKFETPNYGNQQIIINSAFDSVYYILARCVSPNPTLQQIKLKAVKLPFAILNVHTNSGANIGNVTVRIKGSLFSDSMVARLTNGTTSIDASAVYFTNGAQVFATFNLMGKPLGQYDVVLEKTDLSQAVLSNGFSIVPANNGGLITGSQPNSAPGNGNEPGCDPGASSGLNSQLVVELVVPPSALIYGRPLVIQVNYTNPTNFDVPAQSRTLYAEHGLKLSYTKEGVPYGTESLYMELVEPDGPPGIIRAGGSGTITIHTSSPMFLPGSRQVVFKLQ